MQDDQRSTRIPQPIRVFVALRFFATGSYQRGVGEEHTIEMSQPSMSNCINEVCLAIQQIAPRRNDALVSSKADFVVCSKNECYVTVHKNQG
ncbi:hypothetical protein NQ315_012949 [Exocentrus adspersus]|uniref:Uncharacterized protein n=1 Tax=Exocentrus adspersus TaxID=1586481 RepID=A0AAV8VT03_9CUCU|nr:hypothetical protein NQ315_012949 [Exocentrus adspersus]